MLSLLRKTSIDLGPLRRHRDFRLLSLGQIVSYIGSMISFVAIPYQIYQLTHSSLAVGVSGALEFLPIVAFSFVGGAIADSADRRTVLLVTDATLMVCVAILALNATVGSARLWVIYVMGVVIVAVDCIQRPSMDAMLPRLVPAEDMTAAAAIQGSRGALGMIVGPAVGGALIAGVGLHWTFWVDVATYAVSLTTLLLMRPQHPAAGAQRPSLSRMKEGVAYARSRQELMGTYIVDILAMTFGMPIALFPQIASHYGGPEVLGLLTGAPAVGSLLATATSGWTARIRRHGIAVTWAACAWGGAIACFGLANSLPLALAFLALAGAADMVSGIFRMTIWNHTTPDALRGRLAGIELMSYSVGPALSGVESGAVARGFTPRVSVVSGGLLCIGGAIIATLLLPGYRDYRSPEGPTENDVLAAEIGEQPPLS